MANKSELDIIVRAQDETTVRLKQIESSIIRFVGAVSSAISSIAVIAFPVREAAELQRELLNVAKTTDFTEVQIARLTQSLTQFSTEINLTTTELAKIAAIAGQLGLGKAGVEGIAQFTETAARFASVINISAEEAANGLARMLNVFRVNVSEVERISSLLNEISNNSTASGRDLIDIINRIGTAGGTLNIKQAAALAAFGRDLGVSVETVGTSFNKIFLDMQTKSNEIANVLGIPVQEFVRQIKKDGVEALKLYLTALSKMPESVRAAFAEDTTGGGRIFALIANGVNDANNQFALLNKQLQSAGVGFDGGTSSIKEMQRVSQGLLFQVKVLGNVIRNVFTEVGAKSIPFLTKLVNDLQLAFQNPQFITKVIAIGEAIGAFAVAMVEAVKFLLRFSDAFGPLLRILEIFLGLKLVGFILGIGRSLVKTTADVIAATKAFYALAAGQAQVIKTEQGLAAARNSRNAVAISPTAAAIGTVLGAPLRTQEIAKTTALQEQNILMREQARLAGLTAVAQAEEATQRRLTVTALQQEAFLQQRVLALRQGQAAIAGETLRGRIAELGVARLKTIEEQQHLAAIIASNTALLAQQRQTVATAATAAAAARAAVPTLIGAVGIQIGAMFARVMAGIRGLWAAAWAAFLHPITGLLLLISTIVLSFFEFDDIIDFFARLVGISGTARQRAEQDAKIRARAAEAERIRIEQLAAEYDKVKARIENVDPNAGFRSLQDGTLPEFLQSIAKDLDLVKAKTESVVTGIGDIARQRELARQESIRLGRDIAQQEAKIDDLQGRLAGAQAHPQASGLMAEGIKETSEALREATERLNRLKTEQKANVSVQDSLLKQQLASLNQLFNTVKAGGEGQVGLLQQERNLLLSIAPFYSTAAGALLQKAVALAESRKQLEAINSQVKDLNANQSRTEKQEAELSKLKQRQGELIISMKALNEEYERARAAAPVTARAFTEAFGDALGTAPQKAKEMAGIFAAAFDGQLGGLEEEQKRLNGLLETAEKKQNALREVQASASGAQLEAINKQIAAGDKEIESLRAKTVVQKQQIDNAKFLQKAAVDRAKTDEEVRKAAVESGIRLGAQKAQLERVLEAQRRIAEAAAATAAIYKQEYEKAATAAAEAVRESVDRILKFQQKLRDNQKDSKLLGFDQRTARDAKDNAAAQEFVTAEMEKQLQLTKEAGGDAQEQFNAIVGAARFATREYEKQLDAQGITGARARELLAEQEKFADKVIEIYREQFRIAGLTGDVNTEAIRRQIALEREKFEGIKKGQTDVQRAELEFTIAQQKAREAQERITLENQKQLALQKELKEAIEKKDEAQIRNLTQQLALSVAASKQAISSLDEQQTKVAEIGGKLISGEFIGTQPAIDAGRVEAIIRSLNASKEAATAGLVESQRILSAGATQIATNANSAAAATEESINKINGLLDVMSRVSGITVEAFTKAGQKVLEMTEGMSNILAITKQIAESDFSRGPGLIATGVLQQAQKDSTEAIAKVSRDQADAYTEALRQTKSFSDAVRENGRQMMEGIFGGVESIKRAQVELEERIKKGNIQIDNIGFPSAKDKLQEELNRGKPIEVKVQPVTPDGNNITVPAFGRAAGGYIRGPGTTTSDSIPAFLSDKEYVLDAHTTSVFSPAFFRFLQSIAKRGSGAVADFLSVFGSVPIPRFSGGGPVSAGGFFAEGGPVGANSGVMVLRIQDSKGRQVSLFGDRDSVRNTVDIFQKAGYGVTG